MKNPAVCRICVRANRSKIDAGIRRGDATTEIAVRYECSRKALEKHRAHLKRPAPMTAKTPEPAFPIIPANATTLERSRRMAAHFEERFRWLITQNAPASTLAKCSNDLRNWNHQIAKETGAYTREITTRMIVMHPAFLRAYGEIVRELQANTRTIDAVRNLEKTFAQWAGET